MKYKLKKIIEWLITGIGFFIAAILAFVVIGITIGISFKILDLIFPPHLGF